MIKFLLNEEVQEIENVCPNTTVLEYLRGQAGEVGTKEGCASGDCGACTVVTGEISDADPTKIQYKSINSCISLLGSLHGKQLIIVEHLSNGEVLHPAQQAMVDCHGSQCGFCTPGFVMSLFALYRNEIEFDGKQIEHYLAGNLCRCTGYKPIVQAAEKLRLPSRDDAFMEAQADVIATLEELNSDVSPSRLEHEDKVYFHPKSINELLVLLANHKGARLCAGSTDLALELTQQLKEIDTLIFTGSVDELRKINVTEDFVEIGAAVSYESALPVLQEHFPAFVNMLLRLGSKQIRNVGTFGGNIGNASPIGDTPPCFIALNAELFLISSEGERNLKVEDFFIDYKQTVLRPGELISKIRIPKLQTDEWFKTYKISKRIDDDISAVAAAFMFAFEDTDEGKKIMQANLAFGGMAGIPKRAIKTEQVMVGKSWSEQTISDAMRKLESDFNPLSDVRASAHYRMQVAKNLLYKCYLESQDQHENLTVENVTHAQLGL